MKHSIFKTRFSVGIILLGMVLSVEVNAQDLKSAILYSNGEQYEKAEETLQNLIKQEPSNSKNYFYLGENYLLDYLSDTISNSLSEYTKKAENVFRKGIEANPNDPLNYVGLAKIANYNEDPSTADEMRVKAKSCLMPYKKINKKMNPPAKDYAFALAKIADSYIVNGTVDTSLALPLIREAVKIDATNPNIFLIAGDIYILVNDGSNAIKNYNKAQYVDPTSPTANIKIGNIYVRGKSLQAAIPYFEEAISLDANYAPAYRELGQLYWLAGRLEQSKANFKKYLDLTAGNIPAKIRYVNSLFYAGDYDEVISNVEEILKVDNSRAYMNRLAGYSCFDKKDADYPKALEYMNKLFESIDESRILWKDHYYKARILIKLNYDYPKLVEEYKKAPTPELKAQIDEADKQLDMAFAEYNKILEKKTNDKSILSEMATMYYHNKRYTDAAKTWEKNINPEKCKPEDYMKVGRAYYVGGDYKSAESIFNTVTSKWPEHLAAYVYIARTYTKMDENMSLGLPKPKFEKVIEIAKADSIKNNSEMMEAFSYLGYYFMSKDQYNNAKEYYNRMINLNPDNKENKIKGYAGLATIETRLVAADPSLENKLAGLKRSESLYSKILNIDPNNAAAKSSIKWVQQYEASVKKGINPNEIKGKVIDKSGKPIAYASIRVKDTAAENLSNSKGEYKFEIPQGSETLIISAKGYTTKEVKITKSRQYNIVLE